MVEAYLDASPLENYYGTGAYSELDRLRLLEEQTQVESKCEEVGEA